MLIDKWVARYSVVQSIARHDIDLCIPNVIQMVSPRGCRMQGNVCLAEGAARRGLFREAPKPLALLHETITIMDAGRFPEGQTEIPFEAEVKGIDGMVCV